jgi:short-subunit dehydrogenase
MDHSKPLAGKTVIVTGASRGIGCAIATPQDPSRDSW